VAATILPGFENISNSDDVPHSNGVRICRVQRGEFVPERAPQQTLRGETEGGAPDGGRGRGGGTGGEEVHPRQHLRQQPLPLPNAAPQPPHHGPGPLIFESGIQ